MNRALILVALTTASGLSLAQQSSSSGQIIELNPADIRSIESLIGAPAGGSGIVRVSVSNFAAGSGRITFSEFPGGTSNPTYTPANYGGNAANPTVNFGGFFAGQALGTAGTCPPGAALTGCVVGSATNPLTLAPASPATSIVNDGANPTSPVLSGSPIFNGPIAMVFSADQAAVGLDGGFFDSARSTAITAFRRDGTIIGSVTNNGTNIEFLGLATADGTNSIAGLLFSLVGAEAAGFAIDNVRFGTATQVVGVGPRLPVPVNNPWALAALLVAMGLVGVVATRRIG